MELYFLKKCADKYTQLADDISSKVGGGSSKENELQVIPDPSINNSASKTPILASINPIISSSSNEIVFNLNLSIIAGEYYFKSEAKEILKNIADNNNLIISKLQETPKTSDTVIKVIDKSLEYLNTLYEYIEHFSVLISYTEEKLNGSPRIVLDFELEHDLNRHNNKWTTYRKNRSLYLSEIQQFQFLINVRLAQIDEGYTCDKTQIIELLNFYKKLSQLQEQRVKSDRNLPLLIYKCSYLILKILRRIQRSTVDSSELSLDIDNNLLNIENIEDPKFIGPFSIFDDFSKIHYTNGYRNFHSSNPQNEIEVRVLDLLNLNFKKNSLPKVKDIHFISKFVKFNIKNILESLSPAPPEKFEEFFYLVKKHFVNFPAGLSTYIEFDKYGHESAIYLASNAQFRIEIEKVQRITSLEELFVELFISLENFDSNTKEYENRNFKLNNLYRYKLLTEHANNILTKIKLNISKLIKSNDISSINITKVYENIKNLKSKIYSYHFEYEKQINIAKERRLMPIYLPMDECKFNYSIIDFDGQDINKEFFLDSSYILPTDYSSVEKKCEYVYNEFKLIENELSSMLTDVVRDNSLTSIREEIIKNNLKLTEDTQNSIKLNQTFVESRVKDSQVSAIQITGLYAGFITFILGSISIIPKFENSYRAISLSIFVFAAGVGLFVTLLKILFDDDLIVKFKLIFPVFHSRKSPKDLSPLGVIFYFLVFVLLTFIFLVVFLNDSSVKSEKSKELPGVGVNIGVDNSIKIDADSSILLKTNSYTSPKINVNPEILNGIKDTLKQIN